MFKKIFSFTNLTLALSVFVLLPETLFMVPVNGLDPSWMIGINMAVKEHLTFGRDFVFIYGPLGFLWTGLVLFVPKIYVVLFHVFIVICITFIINYFLNRLQSNLSKIAFFLILLFTSANAFNEKACLLFIIFLFFLFYNLQTKKRFAIYVAGIIALISFFIKMNTGLVLTLMLVFFFLFLFLLKSERLKFLIILSGIYFFLLTALSFILHVDLISYITTSLDIINYYNDAAIIPAPANMLALAAAIMFVYATIVLANFKYIKRNRVRLFSFFYVSVTFYIFFKEGFVRADGHVMIFFFKIVTLVSLLYFFENNGQLKKHLFVGILIIGLLSTLSVHLFYPQKDPLKLACNHICKIPYKDFIYNEYPGRLRQAMTIGKSNSMLSQRILQKFDGASVDIIPWDISFVFFNGLKYNPRPVIQSFVAYSEKLDKLNANKYSSKESPGFVLYATGSIDNRHPFWDESKTKLAMLSNFEVVDTAKISIGKGTPAFKRTFILLEKKPIASKMTEVNSTKMVYTIGDTLQIPETDNLIYLFADVEYTVFGKLRRFLYQPNRITVEINYEGTSVSSTNIAVLPILKGGVLINKKVLSFDDALCFFKTFGRDNVNVQKVCFTPQSMWIKKTVNITLKEFKFE